MASSEQQINHLIANVALRIRQTLNLSEILQTTANGLRELLKCDRVVIYRFEPNWSGIVTVESVAEARWSILDNVIRDPCFEESWNAKYREGRVTAIADVNSAKIDQCHRDFLQTFAVRANLVAPILQSISDERFELPEENQLWGLLIAHHCQQPRQWQEFDFDCIKQIADQVAIAIQQAELIERNHQELRQRKLAQQQVQQARQFLQTIIEHLPVAVYVKSVEPENFGKFQFCNPATEAIFGLTADQILGKTVADYFSQAQATRFTQQDREVIRQGTPLELTEATICDRNHNHKIIKVIKIPLYNSLDQPQYILGIAEDITARKQAEIALKQAKAELESRVAQRTEELQNAYQRLQQELIRSEQAQIALQNSEANSRESERRWRSLLENVRLLVISLDREGKIDFVNPCLLELISYNLTKSESAESSHGGVSLTEVIGKNWFADFLAAEEQEQARAIHAQILDSSFSNALYYQQKVLFPQSETEKTIAWNCTQLRNPQGEATGVICIGEDITEQQAIHKKQDEFISVVSHELRTPLTSIRGILALLAENKIMPQSEQGQHLLHIANNSAKYLVKLVNDLLELEHLESNTIELAKEVVNTKELMLRAIDRVQILANKAKVEIEIIESEIKLEADGDRLIQVLTNLLSNGIKFSEPNSVITVSAVRQDTPTSRVLFAVQDRGRGIPSNKLESIFERFQQVDASDSKSKGGTGLGLAISRNIVEQHRGKIWVESIYGAGSTFYFTIPTTALSKK